MWMILVAVGFCALISLMVIAMLFYSARQVDPPPTPHEESWRNRMKGE
jgi:hypothetical protein